jgi:hypothetical protein
MCGADAQLNLPLTSHLQHKAGDENFSFVGGGETLQSCFEKKNDEPTAQREMQANKEKLGGWAPQRGRVS